MNSGVSVFLPQIPTQLQPSDAIIVFTLFLVQLLWFMLETFSTIPGYFNYIQQKSIYFEINVIYDHSIRYSGHCQHHLI